MKVQCFLAAWIDSIPMDSDVISTSVYGRSGRRHVKQVNDTLGEFSSFYGFTWLNHFVKDFFVKKHRRLKFSVWTSM